MLKTKSSDHEDGGSISVPGKYSEVFAESAYSKLSKNRLIFVNEDISNDTASALSALLLYYDNLSHEDDIYLYINSDGGNVSSFLNIYDVMQMISAPIKTICLGRAYSAAALMTACGTKGKRYALKNSSIMIHGVQVGFPMLGDSDHSGSKNFFDFLNGRNDVLMKILARHTGHTLTKIKNDCKRDFYLDASEALKYGIIDGILP